MATSYFAPAFYTIQVVCLDTHSASRGGYHLDELVEQFHVQTEPHHFNLVRHHFYLRAAWLCCRRCHTERPVASHFLPVSGGHASLRWGESLPRRRLGCHCQEIPADRDNASAHAL